MFCNGPEMDGGDTACLGPTTILEITIPRCQLFSAMTLDDAGGLAGPISTRAPLYGPWMKQRLIPYYVVPSTLLSRSKCPTWLKCKLNRAPFLCKYQSITTNINGSHRRCINETKSHDNLLQWQGRINPSICNLETK